MKKFTLSFLGLAAILPVMAQLQAPVQTFPSNGASIADVNVSLTWNPALGGTVTSYEAHLSTDTTFASPVILPIWGTSAKTDELSFNSVYYWRVRAKGTGSTVSSWSPAFSFTTFSNQFTSLAPVVADVNPETNLSWDTVAGVDDYVYEIDEDTLMGSPNTGIVLQPTVTNQAKALMTALNFGTTYFWRVKARHSKDESNWSDVKSFSVLDMFTLISPADSILDINPTQSLACKKTLGVTEYRFAIDDSTDFDVNSEYYSMSSAFHSDFHDKINITHTATKLAFGKTFYWKVMGVNSSGTSSWSNVFSFTTKSDVDLTSPTDGAVGVASVNAKFSWELITGCESYELQYGTDATFTTNTSVNIKYDTANHTTLSFPQWDLPYHWRVRAIHSKDVSDWSAPFSFSVTPTGMEEIPGLKISVFPNPADDHISITTEAGFSDVIRLKLFSIQGAMVDSRILQPSGNRSSCTYDTGSLLSGEYILSIESRGRVGISKLTIK